MRFSPPITDPPARKRILADNGGPHTWEKLDAVPRDFERVLAPEDTCAAHLHDAQHALLTLRLFSAVEIYDSVRDREFEVLADVLLVVFADE
jgi:hypothetical protein